MKDITITISGMSCGHCLNAVNKALSGVAGVEIKTVQMGRADIRVADDSDATQRAVSAVEQAGYHVEGVAA
jgi:copper chaperone CopZ